MINWFNLGLVATAAIGASVFLAAVFALGVRWLFTSRHLSYLKKTSELISVRQGKQSKIVVFRIGAYVMFTICAASVLYGIYLIVPYFHMG